MSPQYSTTPEHNSSLLISPNISPAQTTPMMDHSPTPPMMDLPPIPALTPSPSMAIEPAPIAISEPAQIPTPDQAPFMAPEPAPTLAPRDSDRLRQLYHGSRPSASRGKGEQFAIRRNKMVRKSGGHETVSVKDSWNEYKAALVEKVNREIRKNKGLSEILCEQCEKMVKIKSYLAHKTVNGCKNIDPNIRLYKYKEYFKTLTN